MYEFWKVAFQEVIGKAMRKKIASLGEQEKMEAASFLKSFSNFGGMLVPLILPNGKKSSKELDWSYASECTDWHVTVVGLISFTQQWEDAVEEAELYLTAKGSKVQKVIILDLGYQRAAPHLVIGGDVRLGVFGRSHDGEGMVTILQEVCFPFVSADSGHLLICGTHSTCKSSKEVRARAS